MQYSKVVDREGKKIAGKEFRRGFSQDTDAGCRMLDRRVIHRGLCSVVWRLEAE